MRVDTLDDHFGLPEPVTSGEVKRVTCGVLQIQKRGTVDLTADTSLVPSDLVVSSARPMVEL